jgi:eukaryotic-like serine/threonine-protein kinase
MPIQSGTHLGPYEILSAIGAGGMGEVYRAHDPKLGRDVAIKVLPEAFARNAERMGRFQREAKVLASLNHPNIATIHGLEDSGDTHALVMELVEGPTLADRIKAGPIPVDEAVRIARQIADALEYAHERGIIHRDLKPANVKVTNDDAVKVLDFGLAKALESDMSSIDISTSPTISRMATMQGVLLGTAAYMAPEQAKAKSVDRRADIWAFGCVLYEMLTGKQAFTGETVTDTLASIIKEEPNWKLLPSATPMRVRVLLQRCLQKDPKQRLRDIGDARISLEEVLAGASEASPVASLSRRALPWVAAAAFAIAFVTMGWVHLHAGNARAETAELKRFEIPVPEKMTLGASGSFALSPDGRQLAFAATGSDGVQRLWIRSLDSLKARPLPGSESPQFPPFFWSPDSRYIAFQAGGKLKKIDVSGGSVETLCDLSGGLAVGGSWNRDGVIIFGNSNGGIMRVSANGGSASALTTLDRSRKENVHFLPSFLPDGRHFIYLRGSEKPENGGVYVGSLDAKPEQQDSKRLVATSWGPAYVPSSDPSMGRLLFLRDGTLMAQPFDARRLELSGEPVTVADQVGAFLQGGFFSASINDVLVYRTGGVGGSYQLAWFDRQGKVLGRVGEAGAYATLALSPDGKRAIVGRLDPQGQNVALWLLDLSRGTSTRFTFGDSIALFGTWSPDSSRIIFASNPGGPRGVYDLYQKLASGVKDEELLLQSNENKFPTSWSRDGRFLLYMAPDPKTIKEQLWVLPLEGDKKPFLFLRTESNNAEGQFSPDGHWVAYVSDESGRSEIYVRTFSPGSAAGSSDVGGKWLISTDGGTDPRWRRDGKELYYAALDGKLMAVDVMTTRGFQAGVPIILFTVPPPVAIATAYQWDATPDGERFVAPAPSEQQSAAPFTVVLNWQAGLKK